MRKKSNENLRDGHETQKSKKFTISNLPQLYKSHLLHIKQ